MSDLTLPTIPPIPDPPEGAGALVLDVGDAHRLLFALGGVMPADRQMFGMRRHIESEFRRYWDEYGETVDRLAWRWVR